MMVNDGDGMNCADNDECALETDNCDANASCANNKGSFVCTCNEGWEGTGDVCTDINECAADEYPCDPHGLCINVDASFECACEAGYAGDGFICSDINECLEENACDAYTACDNIAGSHVCT